MTQAIPVSRRFWLIAVTVLAVLVAWGAGLPRASAATPRAPNPAGQDEGSSALHKNLTAAASGYLTARAQVLASQKRQKLLVRQAAETERRLTALTGAAQQLGATAYRGGQPDPLTVLANSDSIPQLVERASFMETISRQTNGTLRELRSTRTRLADEQQAVQAELATQQALAKTLANRKADAEKALADAGGGQSSAGVSSGTSTVAAPATRNSDGSWPAESCSLPDPTSDGCVTPRMLHVYQQARAAGFTHYTHCFRQASSGEHPKGRACDFAADVGGFGGIATGASKLYGNQLAAWGVDNADRLAVLYVIWFKQIWLPGIGWSTYTGDGTPSGDHQNHVHISVQ